ncbi:uncharacterized protein METZ01_LOCUS163763, partial [marine metagenome]
LLVLVSSSLSFTSRNQLVGVISVTAVANHIVALRSLIC